jgi:hypothetical protein
MGLGYKLAKSNTIGIGSASAVKGVIGPKANNSP